MGAASEEGLDGKSGGPPATDLEAPLRRHTLAVPAGAPLCPAGKGQVGGRQAFLCSPPGLDWALSWLRPPCKAADRTCFLTLLITMLESVLSPAAPAKGLTWRPLDPLSTGKWHQELRQLGGCPVPCQQAHSAPQAPTPHRCPWASGLRRVPRTSGPGPRTRWGACAQAGRWGSEPQSGFIPGSGQGEPAGNSPTGCFIREGQECPRTRDIWAETQQEP